MNYRAVLFVGMMELPLIFIATPYTETWFFPAVLLSWQFLILGVLGFANSLPEYNNEVKV